MSGQAAATLARRPAPPLAPFVETLWAVERGSAPTQADRERVLPTGGMHLVMSLTGESFRVSSESGNACAATAFVGGARSRPYLRELAGPRASVGVQLRPGACERLFGVSAAELAEAHTPLEALWGGAAPAALERVAAARGPEAALDALETVIAARLVRPRAMHPAIAHALERFEVAVDVGGVVRETGCSHRRFIALFSRAVGLTPKRYCRVQRFRRAVRLLQGRAGTGLAELAQAAGYSDQAHLSREFREHAGITAAEYRRLAPIRPSHVPLPIR